MKVSESSKAFSQFDGAEINTREGSSVRSEIVDST